VVHIQAQLRPASGTVSTAIRHFASFLGLALFIVGLPGEGVGRAAESDSDASAWVVYPGGEGIGQGKHVVLISGDEEYRSEEALPQLGKILSMRHGFRCTVLFAIDPKTGDISPETQDNIPGLQALESADVMIIATRFRNLPDDQMRYIAEYVAAGKPVIGLRTATHAFNIPADREYARFSFNYGGDEFRQGFGRQVLGETWINHHGHHKVESTRGILTPLGQNHAVTRGIQDGDIWGPTDVYGVRLPLPGDSQPLVLGQVLTGMNPDDPAVEGRKNDPMMPVAWVKTFNGGRVFCTTMGAATDLLSPGVRRMLVNATIWGAGLEERIEPDLNVELVGTYSPSPYGFGDYKTGTKPADYAFGK
jgi:hypothetical protein